MSIALVQPQSAAPEVTTDQLDLIRRTIAKDATPDELKLYLYDCARQGVHPLDRLIHFTKRSGRYTPITSIDFMRIRAADSGEMAGSDDPAFHDTEPSDDNFHATVTVYRMTQGQKFPYTATARWSEYKPDANDFMWKKMPHTMLGKCAEALALRKGFPKQLAGLYAREEMDQAPAPPLVTEAARRVALPEGTVQILKVEPRRANHVEWAEVTYVDHAGVEHTIPTAADPKGSATALFEQLAQEACPVVLTTKITPRSKKTAIDQVRRWAAVTGEATPKDDRSLAEHAALDAEIAAKDAVL